MVRWISALQCDHTIFVISSIIHSNHGSCREILNKIHITICIRIQSEHGNILCEMLMQSKELENITYRYCYNVGMIPLIVHCQVIQNDYLERCSNTCTLQNGYILKGGDIPVFLTIKFHCAKI